MNAAFTANCPHCNFENRLFTDRRLIEPKVIYCNLDEGGCDKPFVVRATVMLSVTVETYKLTYHNVEMHVDNNMMGRGLLP